MDDVSSRPAMQRPDAVSRHSERVAPEQAATSSPRRLTDREKRVLRLVCDGMTNCEIATALSVTHESVKSELRRIFRRIEVLNRTQAAVLVTKHGLL